MGGNFFYPQVGEEMSSNEIEIRICGIYNPAQKFLTISIVECEKDIKTILSKSGIFVTQINIETISKV